MNKKRRSLGYLETLVALFQDYCHGSTNIASITTFKGKLNKQLLPKALSIVQNKHPNLRAKIVKDGKNKYEFIFKNKNYGYSLEIIDSNDEALVTSIIEQNISKPYDIKKDYLWRSILLYGGDKKTSIHRLIIFSHHAIMDGMSVLQFTRDFLYSLAALTKNKEINLPTLPILKSVEKNIERKTTWQEYLDKQLTLTINPSINQTVWKYPNHAELKARKTKFITKTISAEIVTKLINKSREEQTTVNTALNAAVLLTFLKKQEKDYIELNMPTPVNMRVHCKPTISSDNMGNFINWMPVPMKCYKNSKFWEVARSYKETFLNSFEKWGYNPEKCDGKYMLKNEVISFNCPDDIPPIFCTVTNLGIAKFDDDYYPFTLESLNFACSFLSGGVGIAIICSTINGIMHLNFCYTEPIMDKAWLQDFIDNLISLLKDNA
ncbi:MAG: hypothetical protein GY756_26565 [bacterium]|nr:hypothetical protein [bacterium]